MQDTVNLDLWTQELPALVPGVETDYLTAQLRLTLRNFFVTSGCWIEKAREITLTSAADYTIRPPSGTDMLFLYGVYLVNDGENDPFVRATPSDERGFTVPDLDTLHVGARYLKAGDVVQPLLAVKPCDPINKVPVFVRTNFYEGILDGVRARMYQMPKKPWSNGALAGHHGRRFRNAIAEARDFARRGFSMSESAWVYPTWA